ncbi:MAG: hypothetical protein ABH878_02765, partial [bacterium]
AGGIQNLKEQLVTNSIKPFTALIDNASIVFAHSVLDAAAFDFLRVIELIAPLEELEVFVEKTKITLVDAKMSTYDEIAKCKIKNFINDLERSSLLEKIDKIFQICQPPAHYSNVKQYKFDRDKLKILDDLRHSIVHSISNNSLLSNCDDSIEYFWKTSYFLMNLVNYKYKLKLNPNRLREIILPNQ